MKERPILFQPLMVQALMAGIKTETRRLVKPQPISRRHAENRGVDGDVILSIDGELMKLRTSRGRNAGAAGIMVETPYPCPYGVPGDRLWVKESFWRHVGTGQHRYVDKASDASWHECGWKKVPSIHMPRRLSRITLEIVKTWAEQVESITEDGARAEGFADRAAFLHTFYHINKRAEAGSNPWVRAIKFVRVNLNPAKPE